MTPPCAVPRRAGGLYSLANRLSRGVLEPAFLLRHSAATLLLAQGVHHKVLQERLGHSTITVTMDVYSDVMPSLQREGAPHLDRLFAAL